MLCWYLGWIWITRCTLKSFVNGLCVCLAALLYDTLVVPSWGREPQNSTLCSHKRDVNPMFLVSLLGTVVCDDLTGQSETSALLLLSCMCLGATQFSVYLPPNNCLLCLLKRLLTLRSLHPIKYFPYWCLFFFAFLLSCMQWKGGKEVSGDFVYVLGLKEGKMQLLSGLLTLHQFS